MTLGKMTPLKILKKLKMKFNKNTMGERFEECTLHDCSVATKREFYLLYARMITGIQGKVLKIHCCENKKENGYIVQADLFEGHEQIHTMRSESSRKYEYDVEFDDLVCDIEDWIQELILKYENRSYTLDLKAL